MGCRQGPSRRARLVGVLVVGLVLALSLPTVALAANVASFSARTPASGSSLTNAQPTISTVVYDRYGVTGAYPTGYSMTVDGKAVKPSRVYYSGYGYRKFKLSYKPAVALSNAVHTVVVKVKDVRGYTSTTTWKFRVDKAAPVTTVNGPTPAFPGGFFLWLSAVDSGVGVANTYHSLDGAPAVAGNAVWGNLSVGSHTLQYWSVDKLGNVEAGRTLTMNIVSRHATAAGFVASCGAVGCHKSDLAQIHNNACTPCHGVGKTASNNCADCHAITSPMHAVHVAIESSSTAAQTCTQATCHGTNLMQPHASCATCHASANQAVLDVVAAGGAKCESCHTAGYTTIHAGAAAAHASTPFACSNSTCHPADVATVHTAWNDKPGCIVCHGTGITPSKSCGSCHTAAQQDAAHSFAHTALSTALASGSAGCVSCHGSNVMDVDAGSLTLAGEHVGCTCHAYGEVDNQTKCEDCHIKPMDATAPYPYHVGDHASVEATIAGTKSSACVSCHGTNLLDVSANATALAGEHRGCLCHAYNEATPENTECVDCHEGQYAGHGFSGSASGHNTTTYGKVGAYTKWDGSQGVVVKDSMENTITQEWPLPTAGVFWSQANAVKDLAGVVVTASISPTDYPLVAMDNRGFASAAEGAAAIDTEVGWGSVITCYDCHSELEGLVGPQGANAANYGLDANFPDDWTKAELTSWDPTGMRSIATTSGGTNPYYRTLGAYIYTPDDSSIPATGNLVFGQPSTAATLWAGQIYNVGAAASQGYSMGNTSPKRFICIKCHKLTNSFQGQAIEGNGRGNRSNALNYMGFSNYPHMEHHADMITGQGNCVSCHVAIPHGWKRPRLLVYESDPAPYKVQWIFAGMDSTTTAKAPNADLSNGNWGYIGVGSSNTLYFTPGAINPATGKPYSTHLEKVSASPNSHKELEAIPLEHFLAEQHANELEGNPATLWDEWDETTFGVNWHADTSNERGHYNNCSACTSAANRHDDTVAGVAPDVPYWK